MITFTQGNLLEARAEALVNTVNTVGVMGKGIALMFKERFADNFRRYAAACKAKEVHTGTMFVTEVHELFGPRWIVNFPTKQHWRGNSKIEWITEGLQDLRRFLIENNVKSIAIPPLGAGNGGLDWAEVRPRIEEVLAGLDTEILVFEPTQKYQNVAKRTGVEKLTPASPDRIARLLDEVERLRAEVSVAAREAQTLRNQRDELRIILDKRPAMNDGLREAYAKWSAGVYAINEARRALIDAARKEEGK